MPASAATLNPLDLYGVRAMLTEDEQMVQDSVARLVDAEVLPIIRRCFEEHRFPKELVPKLAAPVRGCMMSKGKRFVMIHFDRRYENDACAGSADPDAEVDIVEGDRK